MERPNWCGRCLKVLLSLFLAKEEDLQSGHEGAGQVPFLLAKCTPLQKLLVPLLRPILTCIAVAVPEITTALVLEI